MPTHEHGPNDPDVVAAAEAARVTFSTHDNLDVSMTPAQGGGYHAFLRDEEGPLYLGHFEGWDGVNAALVDMGGDGPFPDTGPAP